jgi:hypothetical protein
MMDQQATPPPDPQQARWQPLAAIDRRVVGVLVEKAKTTPDQYPLSLSALRTGANQKSNRHPIMQLEVDAIEESLDRLRELGAVVEVQGSGRVVRYRHLMYQWLGVEKVELAVMAELLLRGAQKLGELRGRAARMEPLRDMAALQPHLDALETKKLIEYLTPRGRGCVVTHRLYLPNEMAKVRARLAAVEDASEARPTGSDGPRAAAVQPPYESAVPSEMAAAAEVRREVELLRNEFQTLRTQLDALRDELHLHFEESAEKC